MIICYRIKSLLSCHLKSPTLPMLMMVSPSTLCFNATLWSTISSLLKLVMSLYGIWIQVLILLHILYLFMMWIITVKSTNAEQLLYIVSYLPLIFPKSERIRNFSNMKLQVKTDIEYYMPSLVYVILKLWNEPK